jgi:hypothetical protein
MAATMSTVLRLKLAATLFAVVACALAAFAPTARASEDDPPGRVGRVAIVGGTLYLAPEDRANEWAQVGLNYPVASGDNLWVSGDGRAEIDLGGTQLRLAGDTNVHLSRLDERELSLFVAQGRAIVRVRVLQPGDIARVDTPNTQIDLLRPGLYRIDVSNDSQETTLVVREGEAAATVANGIQQVLPGQTATLFGDQFVQADVRNGAGLDGFDAWSADRDRVYRVNAGTVSYVSPQMVGAAELDQYGAWQTYSDYGPVWFPTTVPVGWAPYSDGRWISLTGWGLTWVDGAPWGYAPFHYGRWVFVGGRWGWCPGRYVARPVWAPALVAWYGGSGFAVGGYGPVYGWVPLGWRDPYIPSWHNCSNRCWNNYNRPYAVNVAERPRQPPTHYANYQVPGAVTAVSGAAFAAGKPVAVNRVNLPGGASAALPPLASAPQVKPLPIATNSVRPGHGAPIPASTAFGTTKPMAVGPQRAPLTSAPPGQPWAKPAPAYNAAEAPPRPSYAPQQNRMRTPQEGTAVNRAESTATNAPTTRAVPGAPVSAPPAQMRYLPPPQPPATSAPPAQMRALPPPQPPATSAPAAQMRNVPPPPQGVPQAPAGAQNLAPPPPRPVEKPVAAKPAPAPNQN